MLRQTLLVMLSVCLVFSSAVWLVQALRLIDLIVNRGLSIGVFLHLAILIMPRFIDVVLPIAVFVAAQFVYNKLIAESEMVVMRAAGRQPDGARRAGADHRRHRHDHPLFAVALSAAGLEPRLQGSAIRDPQPLRLGADPGRRLQHADRQADGLCPGPRRQRRPHQHPDLRRSHARQTGDRLRRARRHRQYVRRTAPAAGQRHAPAAR